MSYEGLLAELGLSDKFELFEESHADLFKELSERAPAFVNRTMVRTSDIPMTPSDSAFLNKINETAVTAYFAKLIIAMDKEVTAYNARSDKSQPEKAALPVSIYDFANHQEKTNMDNLGHTADFVLYYSSRAASIESAHISIEATKDELGE
ncbi:hypothetical protein IWW38_004426, partial [Coemansia aciculifera]